MDHHTIKGKNRARRVMECTDDYYTNIALAILHSGVVTRDLAFLTSDWCAWLLDMCGSRLTGLDLLNIYERSRRHGKR